jgi:PPIC-type PPIASE domain
LNATNTGLACLGGTIGLTIVLMCFVCIAGCGSESKALEEKDQEESAGKNVSSFVVARVDGVPISVREISELIEGVDAGLSGEKALELLINNELLGAEASRRGYGKLQEVTDVWRSTLAATLLAREVDEKIRIDTLDDEWLKTLYEQHKARYVHPVLRRVVHIVFKTGKKGMPEPEAKEQALALEARLNEMDDIAQEKFAEICNEVKGTNKKIVIEALPPFVKDGSQFAAPFVEAAFSLKKLGSISGPTKTSYGWHVIYFAEEIAPIDRSFAEVRDELANEVLPQKKIDRAAELMTKLTNDANIFVHDDILNNVGQGQ